MLLRLHPEDGLGLRHDPACGTAPSGRISGPPSGRIMGETSRSPAQEAGPGDQHRRFRLRPRWLPDALQGRLRGPEGPAALRGPRVPAPWFRPCPPEGLRHVRPLDDREPQLGHGPARPWPGAFGHRSVGPALRQPAPRSSWTSCPPRPALPSQDWAARSGRSLTTSTRTPDRRRARRHPGDHPGHREQLPWPVHRVEL